MACTIRTFAVRPTTSRRAVHARAAEEPRSEVSRTATGEEYAKTLPGISGPFGYFDPFGLASKVSEAEVKRYRESELTHGRVCMLAALGFFVGENIEGTNLFINAKGNITGPAINQFQQVPQGFWEPLAIVIGLCEAYRIQIGWNDPVGQDFNTLRDDYQPGDLKFDPLGLKPTDTAGLKELQTKELNNGRLAMIAVAGFVAQELVNQKGIFEHLLNLN